ncbi:hypothetical protein FRB95_009737 [Tulasnella sp. JGI-2019a]|nr:hypothetical protein FRB95_009737 [Tulasnella sp. JGI-2019a]
MATTLSDLNRAHFDRVAATYDDMDNGPMIQIAATGTTVMRETYRFDPESTKVLDFACGTGVMSQQMAPFCKEIQGWDISQKMVDVFNEKAQKSDETKDKLKASVVDLQATGNDLDGQEFDVIICAHAYHHFEDPAQMTKKLIAHLRPGTGALLILDRITNEEIMNLGMSNAQGTSHTGHHNHHHHHPHHENHHPGQSHEHVIAVPGEAGKPSHDFPREAFSHHHAGFEEADIKKLFEDAGLVDFKFIKMPGHILLGVTMDLFVAKGIRSSL